MGLCDASSLPPDVAAPSSSSAPVRVDPPRQPQLPFAGQGVLDRLLGFRAGRLDAADFAAVLEDRGFEAGGVAAQQRAGVEVEIEAGLVADPRPERPGADGGAVHFEREAGLLALGGDGLEGRAAQAHGRGAGRHPKGDPEVAGGGCPAGLAEIGAVARAPLAFVRSGAAAGGGEEKDEPRKEAAEAGQPLIRSRGWPLATPPLSCETCG